MSDAARRSGDGWRRSRKVLAWLLFVAGLGSLGSVLLLIRFAVVTDLLYSSLVKDPERHPPQGNVLVAPADGTVLYVKRVSDGVVPEIVKRGVPVPLVDHLKIGQRPIGDGYLVGIYMNSDSVHVNRVPISGVVQERVVWNGPHVEMTGAERTIILTQLIPGWIAVKKLFGLPPYDIEDRVDYILKSARETLLLRDLRGADVYVVRIADYSVGKILTWVHEGDRVTTGQRMGMITWGSQTDIFFEETPGLSIEVRVGEYVYGGETVLATY